MHTRFKKKLVIRSHDFPFYVAIQCVVVERRSHHASLTKAERVLKKKKIRSPNDAWKSAPYEPKGPMCWYTLGHGLRS